MSEEPFSVEQYDDIDGVVSPASNQRLIGHDQTIAQLSDAAAGGKLHHAWVLQGPRGVGKATAAFAFARELLSGSQDPTSHAATARQIAGGGHPQLIHLSRPKSEKGTFRTQITVTEIRRLNHFFQTTVGVGWRVAIIDPADDLNRNAANALLKILEEPPQRCIFLIVNHSAGRLLPTIRSRCRILRFSPLAPSAIEEILRGVGRGDSAEDLRSAAHAADGSVRTALTLLENGGLEITKTLRTLMAAGEPDWSAVLQMADALSAKGREAAFAFMASELLRLVGISAETSLEAGNQRKAAAYARLWQVEQARWREAEAYNLDRRQTLVSFFERYRAARAIGDD